MSFEDIQITLDNTVANTLVGWLNWAIKYFIKSQEKSIVKVIDQQIGKINDMVEKEQAYTFDIDLIQDLALNLTMTKAPIIKSGSNDMKFNFDGTFNKFQKVIAESQSNQQLPDHDYFPELNSWHH